MTSFGAGQSGKTAPLRRSMQSTTAAKQAAGSSLADQVGASSTTKNVVVVGGSYGGMHAATVLANRLPPSHRVILIERNSHFNHLYVFPRFSTLPGHEHKAFIPYTSIFKDAPERKARMAAESASVAGSSTYHVGESTNTSRKSSPSKREGSEEMLGMGSISGRVLRSKSSTESDSSEDSRLSRSSKSTSSASRSSSVDDDSLFEGDRRRSGTRYLSAADLSASSYSASSSWRSKLSDRGSSTWDDSRDEQASKLSESKGALQAVSQEGIASRAEEQFGRPEIQVEELSDALDKGIVLDDGGEPPKDFVHEEDLPQSLEESSPHIVLQANVASITPTHVIVEAVENGRSKGRLWSIDSIEIPYSHLVYALGSHLPDPLRTETRSKQEGVAWMQEMQRRVKESQEIVLVGGGALGVEFATDIKSVYPQKSVTLIHSRKQLLPNFDVQVHEAALHRLNELGVKSVLGERLALTEGCPRGSSVRPENHSQIRVGTTQSVHAAAAANEICPTSSTTGGEGEQARSEGMCLGNGRKLVKTTGGKEFECDMLLLCTGQQPNSELMAQLSPTSVDGNTRLVRVMRTLQVKVPDPHGSLAQMPFDARPPCGDCDCFLDKKALGANVTEDGVNGVPGHDTSLPNVYAIGDVADAFGALNAGYQAWAMADVATENVLRDINGEEELQSFEPAANMLKLSLGMGKMVFQGGPDEKTGRPLVEVREDAEDLHVEGVWKFMAGMSTDDMYV